MGTSIPSAPLATPSAAGLMSTAQVLALAGQQPSKSSGAAQSFYSDVIDLTTTGLYVVMPPMPYRLLDIASFFEIKSVTTCTVSPTFSVGSNSPSFNNIMVSETAAGFTTQAVETRVSPTAANPTPFLDLTASGLQVNVTGGATATALTARFVVIGLLLPV